MSVNPHGTIKLSTTSKTHIPRIILNECQIKIGEEIPFVIGSNIVLLYNPQVNKDKLLASLEALIESIKVRNRFN